jgi:tetratricopeptide (TPR) repeat protein
VASYSIAGLQYSRAGALAKLGRISDAIAAAQAELQLRPTYQPARDLLTKLSSAEVVIQQALVAGQTALAAGDLAGALGAFTSVTQHDPNLATGFAGLGSALMALGQFADAVAPLRRATELAPEETSLQNQLGVALFQAGDLPQAVAVFRRVWQGNPDDVSAPLNLIDLYRSGGDYAEATAVVTEALRQHPDNCDILAAFGGLCLELGDAEGAQLAWQRIEARDANHPAIAALQQALAAGGSQAQGNDSGNG